MRAIADLDSSPPVAPPVVRRTCACGRHVAGGGECAECRRARERGAGAPAGPGERALAPPLVQDVVRRPGAALDKTTRRSLEQGFGRDFGRVRVHADPHAAESARALDAAAYTVGDHMIFGAGRFAPSTASGRRLLAHELAHVVQQSGAPNGDRPSQRAFGVRDDPRNEHAADAAGAAIVDGRAVPSLGSSAVAFQRQAATAAPARRDAGTGAARAHGDCFVPVSGEEVDALLQSRTVTVIEFWTFWCGPCKDLQADLVQLCRRYRARPPAAPVRFFSVDADDPANAAISQRFGASRSVPQLVIYAGGGLERHLDQRPEIERLEQILTEAIDVAAESGAARGAWTGAKIGGIVGGIAGLLTGIGLSLGGVLTGGVGLLAIGGLAAAGVLGGGLVGGGIGALAGWRSDTRDIEGERRRGAFEGDALIRRRFGSDLPPGIPPLRGAPVRPVMHAELMMLFECRFGQAPAAGIVGWTDWGRENAPAASPEDEPTCRNGRRLEHATPQRPVIYYATDRPDSTVVVHEGLHAYSHFRFSSQLRDVVNEAATEYFTRQIAAEIGASSSGYGQWLDYIHQLVATIGEPALRAAYFRGDFAPANRVLGRCGLEVWAQRHLQFMQQSADDVLAARGGDYCAEYIPYGRPGARS